jgi:cell division protein FtsW
VLPLAIVAALVILEPDLGTTIAIITIGITQIFVSGAPILPFITTLLAGSGIGFLLIIFSEYRKARLSSFLELIENPLNSSNYHIKQILIALGSGGWFGVGLGQGRQKYLFLPESATDSVFANIAEELGFFGGLIVIILLLLFVYEMARIAASSKDHFGTIVGAGIVAWICAQIFLNIASMVALIPLTGVPLPFFSYGGSNLTVILFAVGVLLNISKHEKNN